MFAATTIAAAEPKAIASCDQSGRFDEIRRAPERRQEA
jgi:hypothetical protein